jgi:hypothetical protein
VIWARAAPVQLISLRPDAISVIVASGRFVSDTTSAYGERIRELNVGSVVYFSARRALTLTASSEAGRFARINWIISTMAL